MRSSGTTAGFPQNGSKTPPPRPAARAPSPTPAPTGRKLESSQAGTVRRGWCATQWGPRGRASRSRARGAGDRGGAGDGGARWRTPRHPTHRSGRPSRGAPTRAPHRLAARTHAPTGAHGGRPGRGGPGPSCDRGIPCAFPGAPHRPPAREPRRGGHSTHLSFSMSAAEACEKPKERVRAGGGAGHPREVRPVGSRQRTPPVPARRGPPVLVGATGRGRVTGEPAGPPRSRAPSYAPRGEEGAGPGTRDGPAGALPAAPGGGDRPSP